MMFKNWSHLPTFFFSRFEHGSLLETDAVEIFQEKDFPVRSPVGAVEQVVELGERGPEETQLRNQLPVEAYLRLQEAL